MMLKAKQVVKGKFWIVEKPDGTKVGTVQKNPTGVTFVDRQKRECFPSLKHIHAKYSIAFEEGQDETEPNHEPCQSVYGMPTDSDPIDPLWNVAHKVPTFRKDARSQSIYCAGYYLIEFNKGVLAHMFCPKLISIERYRFFGPFRTQDEAKEYQKTATLSDDDKNVDK